MVDEICGIPCEYSAPWCSSPPHPDIQVAGLVKGGFISGYEDYTLDDDLRRLVEGKRVAYVCPSPHLKGKGMGNFIDSHDLVVRIHQYCDLEEDLHEDYGKRCDILINCMNIHKLNALKDNPYFVKTLKYIICSQVSCQDVARVDNFLESTGIPYQNVSDGYLFKVFKEVGTTVNTGLLGLMALLHYPLKELYITGMTFYNMNKMGDIYFNQYQEEATKYGNFRVIDGSPVISDLRMDIHAQQPQIDYFRKLVNRYYPNKLKLDEFLTDNFNE